MQLPTLQNVRIRSTRDALQVFYAVAMNRLPLITRRLDAEERRAIVAGNVYVWYALMTIWRCSTNAVEQGRNVARIQSPQVWAWKDGENCAVLNLATRDAMSIPQD